MPVISGAGGGVGKIIAGVALVALSFALPGSTIGLFGLGTIGLTAFAAPVLAIGASLVLGGVSQLLTPAPRLAAPGAGGNREVDPRESFSFSGIQNTSRRQGIPVPIVYGETIVGSVVISAGIDTVRVRG
jgi:predicted phage tail protein